MHFYVLSILLLWFESKGLGWYGGGLIREHVVMAE